MAKWNGPRRVRSKGRSGGGQRRGRLQLRVRFYSKCNWENGWNSCKEAGTNLHFATHAEGIDTLISNRLHGMRPDNLPVIILRPLIDRL